jgi:hypothetical protein
MLKERGQDISEGTRVEYVVLDDEATSAAKRFLPAEDYRGECDRHYVWESLVYPATQRLLEAAFPAQATQWAAWARSRPPKVRGRKVEGVGDLFGGEVTGAPTAVREPLTLVPYTGHRRRK